MFRIPTTYKRVSPRLLATLKALLLELGFILLSVSIINGQLVVVVKVNTATTTTNLMLNISNISTFTNCAANCICTSSNVCCASLDASLVAVLLVTICLTSPSLSLYHRHKSWLLM